MYIENNDIFVKDFFLIFFFLKFIDYSLEVIARAFMIFSMPLLPRVTTIISLRKYIAGKKIQQSTKELIVWSDRDELLALYNQPSACDTSARNPLWPHYYASADCSE